VSKSIIVEGISKKFTLHHEKERASSGNPLARLASLFQRKTTNESDEVFWALRDISFEVEQGQRMAIVGRNGAGKSTLLKILSRVMSPTEGRIQIHGRLSSLLEVGTGFHPDLTGRENIYLNGAVLGMSRAEVRRKFDAMVDFAEVEAFLDTPVKHYSSGMYVRLAFSVSAFLEPDIVILDEVLSVGDAGFQKKSLRKLREITSEGRTVILVSHSMPAVRDFCTRALLIENGRTRGVVDVEEAVASYDAENRVEESTQLCAKWVAPPVNDSAKDVGRLTHLRLSDAKGNDVAPEFPYDRPVWVELGFEIQELSEELTVGFALYDEMDNLLFWSFQVDSGLDVQRAQVQGLNLFRVELPVASLNNGIFRLKALAGVYNKRWIVSPDDPVGVLRFAINGRLSDSAFWQLKRPGIIAPRLSWSSAPGAVCG
jgi:lipopolysaccharide transport system ATP-binding protein